MPFIRLNQAADNARVIDLLCRSAFARVTSFESRNEQRVLAVPAPALDDLTDHDVPYEVIPEDRLPEVLSENGLQYVELLKQENPDLLYFNAPLPPLHWVEYSFRTLRWNVELVQEALGRYEHAELSVRGPDEVQVIDLGDPEMPDEDYVVVSFIAPAAVKDALLEHLSSARLAGYSYKTRILSSRDPDGEPG